MKQEIINIPVEQVFPFPENPFHIVENDSLKELEESIRELGVMSPILVIGIRTSAGKKRLLLCCTQLLQPTE